MLKNQVHLKTYSNGHIADFVSRGGGGGRALGYFLGGYVPPGSPNWHPVPKNISPVTAPGSSYKSCDHNSGYEGKCFDHQKGWNRLNTAEVLLQMPLSEIKRKTCWNEISAQSGKLSNPEGNNHGIFLQVRISLVGWVDLTGQTNSHRFSIWELKALSLPCTANSQTFRVGWPRRNAGTISSWVKIAVT